MSTSSTDNKKSSTTSKTAKVEETNTIKYQELLQHFKSVQSRHEKQRRQCKCLVVAKKFIYEKYIDFVFILALQNVSRFTSTNNIPNNRTRRPRLLYGKVYTGVKNNKREMKLTSIF